MNKKNINYIILITFFLIFFIYSYFAIFNKESFTRFHHSEYIFTIEIDRDFNQNNISTKDLKSKRQPESSTTRECTDSFPSSFYYEPLYFSIFEGAPLNKYIQIRVVQDTPNFLLFSLYKKNDIELDHNALKIHTQETLEPFLDHSPGCIGKVNMKIYG